MSSRPSILYLATFDPTISTTGTSTRGKLFLDSFSRRYEVHLVYMEEQRPAERTGVLPAERTGVLPAERTGVLPAERTLVLPAERTLVLPAEPDAGLLGRLAGAQRMPYSRVGYFLYSPLLYRAAESVLRSRPVDMIFADFEKSGFYAARLSRRYRLPFIYNSHNVEYRRYLDFARTKKLRYPLAPYMYALERRAVQAAELTIAISEPDAAVFRRWVPAEKVLALPAAFDEQRYCPSAQEETNLPPVVLMVGNYRNPGNRLGASLLVERILPAVLARRPDVVFRMVGKNFPENLAHPNLQVAGFVDDLAAEYRRASLVVAPVPVGGGIKIKVAEGLACGRTVIATPKGAEGFPTDLAQLLVREIEAFPQAILAALDRPPKPAPRDWERLAGGYGMRSALQALHGRIDALLSG